MKETVEILFYIVVLSVSLWLVTAMVEKKEREFLASCVKMHTQEECRMQVLQGRLAF